LGGRAESTGSAVKGLGGLCFSSGVENEVEVGGKKLAGCAHKLTREAFFSHGSVMTGPRHVALARLVRPDSEHSTAELVRSLEENSVSLSELLPALPATAVMETAFKSAFEEVLGTRFVPGSLSAAEVRVVDQRAAEKRSVPATAAQKRSTLERAGQTGAPSGGAR
jgi:lipoate-protein ligase A